MQDSTVVVTGATSGIGRAVAAAFAERDATVGICGRDADTVAETVAALEDGGAGDVVGVRADVRDEFDVERFVETTARAGDGIDVVVANAGVFHGVPGESPIDETPYSAFDDEFRTNVRGVFATFREALAHCNPDARLLAATGSVATDAHPGLGAYAPSKAGMEGVVRQFAVDTDHVVGCVDPGQVATDLSGPGGRDPDAIADMFHWAATDCDADDLDGRVVDLADWKSATRR